MAEKRDYYIVDEYGDVWNDEPFPTFHSAYSFRAMIRPWMNRITELSIASVIRGGQLKCQKKRILTNLLKNTA
jgi:hypothetical protein